MSSWRSKTHHSTILPLIEPLVSDVRKTSDKVTWLQIDLHLLWKVVLLIAASPIIVFGISWIIQHLYFRDLYREPDTHAWYTERGSIPCDVTENSGIWMTLNCAGQIRIAPLAGIQTPIDEKNALNVSAALDRLWRLRTDSNRVEFTCQLVSVKTKSSKEEAIQQLDFARCAIGKVSVTRLLLSAGAVLAPQGSPTLSALDPADLELAKDQADDAAYDKQNPRQDSRRTTALAIQAWVATILGFVGAAVGVIEASHGRAESEIARKTRLRKEGGEHLDRFLDCKNRLKQTSARDAVDRQRKRTREALSELQNNLREQSGYKESRMSQDLSEALSNIGDDLDDEKYPSDVDIQVVITSLQRFTKA